MGHPLPLWTQVLRYIVCLLLSFWFLAGALVITNGRMPDPKDMPPLPDILFELLPKVQEVEMLTDVIIFILVASTVFTLWKLYLLERKERGDKPLYLSLYFNGLSCIVNRVLFTVMDTGRRPFPLTGSCAIGLIRFLVTYTIVVLFRAVVIVSTSYPATDNQCQHPVPIEHPLINMVLTVVTLGSGAIHCGDLMYSGHTIILCLAACMLWDYGIYLHRFALRVFPPLLVLLSFYCIIASRSHYTDDILVSAYITIATFLLVPHSQEGAPKLIQYIILYWPCLGENDDSAELILDEVMSVVVVPMAEEEAREGDGDERLPVGMSEGHSSK